MPETGILVSRNLGLLAGIFLGYSSSISLIVPHWSEIHREIDRETVSLNGDIGPFRKLSTYIPSMNDTFGLLLTLRNPLRNLYTTMRSMMGA